jgi:hypothetical protein
MRNETLIVEDLLLLMLDDETGTPAGAGTLYYPLGGAVLVELALLGRIEAEEGAGGLNGPKVHAVGDGPLGDPLLQAAYDKVADRPRGVQTLLVEIGTRLWEPLVDRLVERGLIRREKKRVLGVFRMNTLPAADSEHEDALRQAIRAVLEEGAEPDPRTAAVIALLSSSGTLPMLRPPLPWSGQVHRRAKALEQGDWGARAVNTAVSRTTAAIAAASAAVAVTVATSTN